MCDFVTLAIVSSVVSAAGAVQAGQAQAAAATYQAKLANMNADIADKQARDELERGAQEEQRKRIEVSQVQSRQQAAMAANGLDITFGSPLDTLVDTAYAGEMDALTLRANANRAAYNREVDAVNMRAQSTLFEQEATQARTAGMMSAVGSALSGASAAYGKMADVYGPGTGFKSYYSQTYPKMFSSAASGAGRI